MLRTGEAAIRQPKAKQIIGEIVVGVVVEPLFVEDNSINS